MSLPSVPMDVALVGTTLWVAMSDVSGNGELLAIDAQTDTVIGDTSVDGPATHVAADATSLWVTHAGVPATPDITRFVEDQPGQLTPIDSRTFVGEYSNDLVTDGFHVWAIGGSGALLMNPAHADADRSVLLPGIGQTAAYTGERMWVVGDVIAGWSPVAIVDSLGVVEEPHAVVPGARGAAFDGERVWIGHLARNYPTQVPPEDRVHLLTGFPA